MLFNSIEFGFFLLIVFAAYWSASKQPLTRKYILIIAGILFLGYGSKILALSLVVSAASTWFFGRTIFRSDDPGERRNSFLLSLGINILILAAAKSGYSGGIEKMISGGSVADPFSLTSAHGFLTYGVLFFTLQAIGYTVDVFRGDTGEELSFVDVFLLIGYFPKFVAGPLVSNTGFPGQLDSALTAEKIDASRGFYYIVRGLFKKTVLANYLAVRLVDPFYSDPGSFSSPDALLALLGFVLQFYWNLSGLFDIGRGVSLLFGVELPENFQNPFTASGIGDFFRRFNLTLTQWAKRYITAPLKVKEDHQSVVYLFIAALFGGLWYGTGWNALILGALSGGLLVAARGISGGKQSDGKSFSHFAGIFATVALVSLLLVFLRSENPGTAFNVLGTLFSFNFQGSTIDPLLLTVIIWGFAIQFFPWSISETIVRKLSWLHPLTQAVIIGSAIVLISSLAIGNFPDFNHFAF